MSGSGFCGCTWIVAVFAPNQRRTNGKKLIPGLLRRVRIGVGAMRLPRRERSERPMPAASRRRAIQEPRTRASTSIAAPGGGGLPLATTGTKVSVRSDTYASSTNETQRFCGLGGIALGGFRDGLPVGFAAVRRGRRPCGVGVRVIVIARIAAAIHVARFGRTSIFGLAQQSVRPLLRGSPDDFLRDETLKLPTS